LPVSPSANKLRENDMSKTPRYKRVLLKISGEGLCSPGGFGIETSAVSVVVEEIRPLVEMGVQVGLVIGGGNFIRGRDLTDNPYIHRVTADNMGMLATVINGIALQDALESNEVPARMLSALPMGQICEPFVPREGIRYLEEGRVVILAGGTGNPFFTTDMCAALRANELGAEVLLKATKVDGVFDADPVTHPEAKKYEKLSYKKFLADKLGVMDLTAISLCMENRTPIIVFQLTKKGNLLKAATGQSIGTVITD
jgi:uridylate kinase